MIRFDTVTKRYAGGREALSEVSFAIEAGEMVYVTGHSGAGKSTVLKLLSAQERPTRGRVLVDGRNVGTLAAREVPGLRRRIGQVFQDHRLLADRTVFDNVALPLVIAAVRRPELDKRARSPHARRWSSPTSRPAILIPISPPRSWGCLPRWRSRA